MYVASIASASRFCLSKLKDRLGLLLTSEMQVQNMKPAIKRNALSLQRKVDILNEVESQKYKKKDIARKFNIPSNTLSTLIKNKEKIFDAYNFNKVGPNRKKMRVAVFNDVEEALMKWFNEARRSRKFPITAALMQQKAQSLAVLLGHDNFVATNGWMCRFRARHGISSKLICGEAASVDGYVVETWKNAKLPNLLKGYSASEIYNADESGLYYKMLPNRTYAVQGEKCHGGKINKDRITALLCCNLDGSDQLKPLIVGKSAKPRCFKNVTNLNVDYRANNSSWVTTEIFSSWLLQFDRHLTREQKRGILFIDNCSAHTVQVKLQSSTVIFFPPNATSCLQPLDQGVIHAWKAGYRRRLLERTLLNLEKKEDTKIDLRMAIQMLVAAWWSITPETISNCFRKCGFQVVEADDSQPHSENSCDSRPSSEDGDSRARSEDGGRPRSEDDGRPPFSETLPNTYVDETTRIRDMLADATCDFDPSSVDEFLNCDENLQVTPDLTDEAVVRAVLEKGQTPVDAVSDDDDDSACTTSQPVSVARAIDAVSVLRYFFEEQDGMPNSMILSIDKLESEIFRVSARCQKQKKIVDYFKQ